MKKLLNLVLLLVIFCLGVCSASAQTAPAKKSVKSHALAKALLAPVKVATVAPKAAAVGIKDTVGGVLFAAEAVVDVIHVGTSALNKAASTELKHNPFEYVDKAVSYADSGLEKGYLFFFHVQI